MGNRELINFFSKILTDGAVFENFVREGSTSMVNMVGLVSKNGEQHSVSAFWNEARTRIAYGVIWLTREMKAAGIQVPPFATIKWRDRNKKWQNGGNVVSTTCVGIPCIKYRFAKGVAITGLEAIFPASDQWVFVTEISLEPY